MRLVLLASCTLLVMSIASAAVGDRVYRWKGADGKTYYGDTPPADAQEVRNFDSKYSGPSNPSDTAAPTQLTEEQIAARDAGCANKRSQLKSYRNATRLVERDALGREREYTVEERQQLVTKIESEIQSQCGDTPQE
jgi:hypothetical protein